ncbi:MAG: OmpA family protein [Silicimonas sp.]|nr:OmpA family protein [Silicimonas sp.]
MSMVRPSVVKVISVSLFAVISGCAAPQSLETSRSSTAILVPTPAAVSALSRKFRAETPYIVNFGFDSDRLDAQALAELDSQADWIIDHPNVKFRVYGHTDRVGHHDYNAALGLRRAEQVVAYFMSRGISEDRLETMASFGEDLPLVDTDAAEPMNRRTMTDVIGFLVPVREDNAPGIRHSNLQHRVEVDVIPIVDTDQGQVPDDDGPVDNGPIDDGPTDDGPTDDGPTDDGPSDDEPTDNGPTDNGPTDDDPTEDDGETTDSGGGNQHPGGQRPNAGRGNGDEDGDPGKSGGKNNGGDEVT